MSKGMTVMFAQDYVEGTVSIICQDTAMHRDYFRAVYGFCPRNADYIFASVEDFDLEMNRLGEMAHAKWEAEKAQEIAAYDKWIRGVHAMARQHSISVKDAVRWTLDAEGINMRHQQDVEHFCWQMGFPLRNYKLILKTQGR